MNRLAAFGRREDGGSAVEFSLLVTIFATVVLGALEYGWYMWTANALQQTALQTARCMGILQTNCAPSRTYSASSSQTYAQQVAAGYGITVPTASISVTNAATCGGAANLSKVTISYTYQSSVPVLLPGLSSQPLAESACFPNQS